MLPDYSLVYGVPIAIALIADGIETVMRCGLYKKNTRILNEFREDLKKISHEKPDYGFVIPVYRNPEEVGKCLESLINEKGIPKTEIITVDDFSNDNGETKRAASKYGVEVLEVDKEEKFIQRIAAQKKGVTKWLERGKKYVIFLDSDSYIRTSPSNLELAMAEMNLFNLDAMAGQVIPKIDKNSNLLERIQSIEYKHSMRAGRGSMYSLEKHNDNEVQNFTDLKNKYSLKQASQLCVSGAFGIFKPEPLRQVLNEIKVYGGGDDAELTQRLLAKKSKIGYNNSIIVETEAPKSISKWFKQRDRWAQGTPHYLFDAGYVFNVFKKEDSKWKPNYDAGGLALRIQILRDVLMHPFKLGSMPALAMNPPLFATLMAIYNGMNWYAHIQTKEKEEKIDVKAELVLPFYNIAQLIGPVTVGYAKQFGRIFNFKKRKMNLMPRA